MLSSPELFTQMLANVKLAEKELDQHANRKRRQQEKRERDRVAFDKKQLKPAYFYLDWGMHLQAAKAQIGGFFRRQASGEERQQLSN